jgi:hypothetical protein
MTRRWKEQREDETGAEYLARIRSVYGNERLRGPKTKEKGVKLKVGAYSSAAPIKGLAAVPNAADYCEVDGGEWLWWDGNSWGQKTGTQKMHTNGTGVIRKNFKRDH